MLQKKLWKRSETCELRTRYFERHEFSQQKPNIS